ncbi:Similar to TMED8: Protein TMED8 (Pongo abelii) [Cotesia congregata]|uniref:Similar to TMED8: Protein TMED8 (Pongo abelii) n=1 Tax=Cotesia congregata TaxID=51543 RepID=A0A8J2MPI0_COTCN|nr:Similar to TMED8: Protein TMED8 (Pongo abelii) [Cotesia congregata]
MASVDNDDLSSSAKITEDIEKLSVAGNDNQMENKTKNIYDDNKNHNNPENSEAKLDNKQDDEFKPHLTGFEIRDLYKIALNFYKEKEGKAVHLSYEDKLKLVAFTQQATHGKCTPENSPELGVLDVIGKDRRLAWQNLGDITKDQAMEGFVVLLDKLCPLFRTVVEAQKRNIEEQKRLKQAEAQKKLDDELREKEAAEEKKREEADRVQREYQRRQIQDALNQQTYYQFKAYAEQQYPGNPEEQGVLIRQLQEQHYHRYMQQLHQNRLMIDESAELDKKDPDQERERERSREITAEDNQFKPDLKIMINDDNKTEIIIDNAKSLDKKKIDDDELDDDDNEDDENEAANDKNKNDDEDSDDQPDWPPIETPKMWTRPGVDEFKKLIKRESGDAVIKVGHGETVTVRVPTHEDGSCLFWEFATDGYDIGFGVYFEWSKPDTNQVSVHISESEDDDDDEIYDSGEDLECGPGNEENRTELKTAAAPISVIIPIYRRDSQDEIYAGSHTYPGQGIYLLKFDNSYSLWRSKTLYYRVYYTRPGFANDSS